jgi:hypothetical protein
VGTRRRLVRPGAPSQDIKTGGHYGKTRMQLRVSSGDTDEGGLGAVGGRWWPPPAAGWRGGGGGVGMLHCRDMYEAKRMKSEAGIATSEFSNSVVCGGCSHCHSKLRKWEWEL